MDVSCFEYLPAPEARDLAEVRDRYGCIVGGRELKGRRTMATVDPATGDELAQVVLGGEREVDAAVAAARAALPGWSATPGIERAKVLYRVARALQDRARHFAVLETLDGGKPVRESRDFDVPAAAQHFFHYAGWADKLEHAAAGTRPVGVVAAVIPWNFPLMMAAWKIAPALAAGCTVVLKPSDTTPLSALALVELMHQVGVPPGVVNVVTGDGTTGELLARHGGIDKLAFTGSTGVGRHLARLAAPRRLPLTLELGGKSADVVYADAPHGVVEGVVNSIFFNQGHVCCAGSRLLVQEPVYDELVDALLERVAHLRVGDPLDKNTDVGAVNSALQLGRINAMVDAARADGATVVTGGQELPGRGSFCAPTVVLDASPAAAVCREEVFGPVLAVLPFRTPQEAVELANDTTYGLAAGVWSSDPAQLAWTAQRLRAGVVWANTWNRFDPASPFGGTKESGYGREGGRHGLEAFVV